MKATKGSLNYHFVGLGGSGMSALAQLLRARGHTVSGSDRNLDRGLNHTLFHKLSRLGISCLPQNGSGLENGVDIVVVSTAVEESNPDIKMARERGIPIVNRAALLAVLFNDLRGIAIGGTNGKTTVTGMVGWILDRAGLDPTVIMGGMMKNYSNRSQPGNARVGRSDITVIEADESDGSLIYYRPKVGVITNITKDHKPIGELIMLFSSFADGSSKLVLGADCPVASSIRPIPRGTITFGFSEKALFRATDVACKDWSSSFKVEDVPFKLKLPGRHNVLNALAAIVTAHLLSVPLEVSAKALKDFKGVSRRLDLIGETRGIKVIDDFAHNPQKIKAAIESVRPTSRRILAIYQPHGFSPTRFLKEELVQTISEGLSADDILFMPEIFYAGGTVSKDISSRDIIESVAAQGIRAHFVTERTGIRGHICEEARPGDTVLVMGARDDTLTEFCQEILGSLSGKRPKKNAYR
ncbi:MAG: UDP-N-acetylmuramate--L-alanine ligase [Candidatus Brocadiales bacterium]